MKNKFLVFGFAKFANNNSNNNCNYRKSCPSKTGSSFSFRLLLNNLDLGIRVTLFNSNSVTAAISNYCN